MISTENEFKQYCNPLNLRSDINIDNRYGLYDFGGVSRDRGDTQNNEVQRGVYKDYKNPCKSLILNYNPSSCYCSALYKPGKHGTETT